MSTYALPTASIKSVIAAAVSTAAGPFIPPQDPMVYDEDPERAYAKVKQTTAPWVLVALGPAQNETMLAARTRQFELPVSIYWLVHALNDSDATDTLTGVLDDFVIALQANGNRWSGVTNMNHMGLPTIDFTHQYANEWRDNGWASARIELTIRMDYVEG